MEKELFSPMAIDALGEMMNISLGSSATAVSNMLDQRVDITTPEVSVVHVSEFSLGDLEPAMGVEIKYVSGLEGSNIMLLKRSDIKVIVDILMGSEMSDEDFELNDLTISAVCELMNQMMGAAATALSDFLGYSVNISTPEPFELDNLDEFKVQHLPQSSEDIVVVQFALKIEGALESSFMNVMSVELAKELLSGLGVDVQEGGQPQPAPTNTPTPAPAAGGDGGKLSQEEIEKMLQGNSGAQPAPAAGGDGGKLSQEEIERMLQDNSGAQPATAAGGDGGKLSQEEIEKMLQGNNGAQVAPVQAPVASPMPAYTPDGQPMANGSMGYPPMYYPPYPYPPMGSMNSRVVNAKSVEMPIMEMPEELSEEQAQNLELIMEVPLQVTVEIGRTKRKVQDVLSFSKGSLVVLDRLAGDQVDIFVNGKCIGRGDVVVIDDNFGVRITEIVQEPTLATLTKK